jgi:hypothetical protein
VRTGRACNSTWACSTAHVRCKAFSARVRVSRLTGNRRLTRSSQHCLALLWSCRCMAFPFCSAHSSRKGVVVILYGSGYARCLTRFCYVHAYGGTLLAPGKTRLTWVGEDG